MTEIVKGIVIKKIDYQEFDEIITILTKEEILTFIALGVRKMKSKNRMSLHRGNIIEAEIFRARLTGKMSKLKRATLVAQPPTLVSDTASVILEIIANLRKLDRTNEKLYNAILLSYPYFGEDYNHHIKTYIAFNMLSALGLQPYTKGCVICKRNDRIIEFNFDSGGYLCAIHGRNKDPLKLLKAFWDITESFEKYKNVDAFNNKEIYLRIKNYINKNTIY